METRPQVTKAEELARVYQEVATRSAKVLNKIAKRRPQLSAVNDELGIAKAYMDRSISTLCSRSPDASCARDSPRPGARAVGSALSQMRQS